MDPNNDNTWYSQWEQQYDSQGLDADEEYANVGETCRTVLFGHFQDSAGAIGHLYAAKRLPHADDAATLWTAFRLAAETVTGLYRASMESVKRSEEAGISIGNARRSREFISWIRKYKRTHIRKDDLIAYLTGRPPPIQPTNRSLLRSSPRSRTLTPTAPETETNLDMFSEALATTQINTTTTNRLNRSPHRVEHNTTQGDLSAFIASEIARHCKRPAPSSSPTDVTMDSPTHQQKRQRYM